MYVSIEHEGMTTFCFVHLMCTFSLYNSCCWMFRCLLVRSFMSLLVTVIISVFSYEDLCKWKGLI